MSRSQLTQLLVVGALAAAGAAWSAPGDIDPGFGERGRVPAPNPPLVGRTGNLSLIDTHGTTVTVNDANGKPVAGASFAIPRSNGVRSVYGWVHDAQGGYLISVTVDTHSGIQSGLMRLDAQGRLDSRYGVDGIAVVQDASRLVAENRGPYQPQSLLIESVQVLPDGRVLLLESELPYPSCLKSLGLGIELDFDACWGWIESPQRTWMRRLRSDGSIDESFGAGGRASMGNPGTGVTLFATRADGSPVLVEGGGQIRTFAPDGAPSLERRVSFFPISGAVLPDGGLLLVGRRNETPKGVWVTRLDARLEPIAATGEASGETRLDLAGLYSGDTSGESYTGVVSLSPDARYAYFPASFIDTSNSRGRCGGVARLRLDGAPVFDETFGRHGLVCLFADQANGVRVLPTGDVLLQTSDDWSESYPPLLYRLHGGDRAGPGFVRFTGPVYGLAYIASIDEGAGAVTLRTKRMAGKSGPASVEWRVIETQGNPSISGARSGRLEWADGDDGDKTFTLPLIDDQLTSPINSYNRPFPSSVTFALAAVETSSTNAVVGEATFKLEILDNDSPPLGAQYKALDETQRRAEGGGAFGPWALLALTFLWLRQQPHRAVRKSSGRGAIASLIAHQGDRLGAAGRSPPLAPGINHSSRAGAFPIACLAGLSCATAGLLQGCGDESGPQAGASGPDYRFQSDIVQQWSIKAAETYNASSQFPDPITNVEKRPAWPVEMAAVHIAMHDALLCIFNSSFRAFLVEGCTSPVGPIYSGSGMEAAVTAAAYEVIRGFWPDRASIYQPLYDDTLARLKGGAATEEVTRGLALGLEVGTKVLKGRANDGRMLNPAPYVTGTQAGEYRLPTMSLASPYIASITPFLVRASDRRAPGPYILADPRYATDFNETRDLGGANSSLRSAAQTESARFHTEAPDVHWTRNLAQFAHFRPGSRTLMEDAQLSAVIWVSVADSVIICWESKFHYWSWRPQSAIALAASDGNDDTEADPGWAPLGPVPALPEYPAEQTCVASAVAASIDRLFANRADFSFDARLDSSPVLAHHYTATREMLEDYFMGRIWGGQHFRKSLEDGRTIGARSAELAWKRALDAGSALGP